jgi:hypothetical protein
MRKQIYGMGEEEIRRFLAKKPVRRAKPPPKTPSAKKRTKGASAASEIAECPRCGDQIRLVKTVYGVKRYELGYYYDEPHVCFTDRVSSGAFETNRRRH